MIQIESIKSYELKLLEL